MLLGLIHEGEGVAAKALESLEISLEAVRAQVEEIIQATIAELGATSPADMGQVMKAVQPKLAGRADNRLVSQLVRSPGVYYSIDPDIFNQTGRELFSAKVIPNRGAWLEFEIDKKDLVAVRVDRKRKQPVTVLLKALGMTREQIVERFGQYETFMATLEKDNIATQEDALLDIYRKLRPGEPPTVENARNLLDNFYFNPKRYDLAKVGRYKVNKKLGLDQPLNQSTLTLDDIEIGRAHV